MAWNMESQYVHMLCSLIWSIQPALVVESGSGKGETASHLAYACENIGAKFITFEPDPEFFPQAQQALSGFDCVELREGDSFRLLPKEVPDLIIIDSFPAERRVAEITHWLTNAPPTTWIAIHDANRDYYPLDLGTGMHLPGGVGLWIGHSGS